MLFTTKKRGATPATPHQIRMHQEERQRKYGLAGRESVLCQPEMPNNWQPLSNNERYQMWVAKKGEAA